MPAHPYSEIQHTEYEKIESRKSKCDSCEQFTSGVVQRCKECAFTTCLRCHHNRLYHYLHILNDLRLDWNPRRRFRKWSNRHAANLLVQAMLAEQEAPSAEKAK
ncbi:hypothetical protein ANO14919_001810 [Xylariales sp. No.14919]|nr:hypothetical protein ANO14919_001810 [Xylariales sp. No.14919]